MSAAARRSDAPSRGAESSPVTGSSGIYFSIVQRKLLQPNDFDDLAVLARALNEFESHYNQVAEPFDWQFTREDLADLLQRLSAREPQLRLAA